MTVAAATKRLILFDLDGVLLDSRANMETAWAAVRAETGVTVPFEHYFAEIGRPFGDIMVRLGLGGDSEAIEAVFRRASREALADAPIYAGAEAMLAALKAAGRKIGIVTSKDRSRTELVLSRLGVAFDTVQTPDATCRGKPAPDHLMMAMALCNADPAETVFVGDMDSDAQAAARAGIDYIHADWGYGEVPATAVATLSNCAALSDHFLSAASSRGRTRP